MQIGMGCGRHMQIKKPSRINVRFVGLRQARLQNLFELVGRVEAPKSGSDFFNLHRFVLGFVSFVFSNLDAGL